MKLIENYLNNGCNFYSCMKDINIELKDKTHSLAKVCAVLKNTTLKQYIQKAIAAAIEKDKEELKKL